MPNPLLLVIGVVVGAALGALIAYVWLGSVRRQRDLVSTAEREKLLSDAETQMKEMVLEAKEEAHRIRMSLEQEVREARAEIQRSERRVQQKEESIDRKLEDLDRKEQAVTAKELEIGRTRERVNDALAEQVKELERISGMTRVEARTTILTNLEKELSQEMAQKIREGEEVVKEESEKRARNILVTAMQRVAAEQTAETSVSVVAIPSDEMKGRIIGREGRNIRALEHATGVDLIIDDTPEAVILSGFDPVRREVARDRKSTRLNSSHSQISYAVFCLKKKKKYTCIVTIYVILIYSIFIPTHDTVIHCISLLGLLFDHYFREVCAYVAHVVHDTVTYLC